MSKGRKLLTIVLCTLRPDPKFADFVQSLLTSAEMHKDILWDFICVDGMLWYDQARRDQLTSAVDGRFPYLHVPPKPTVWQGPHRLTGKDHWDLCSARNTALAYAQTEHIVFVDDCISVSEDWLLHHHAAAEQGHALAGGVFAHYEDHRMLAPDGPCSGGWLYGMNMSFPLVHAIAADGYDEMYSGQVGSEDCDFGIRIERLGCSVIFSRAANVTQNVESHAPLCGTPALWQKGDASGMKTRLLGDGREHYANQVLIVDLLRDVHRTTSVGNMTDIRSLRECVSLYMPFPTPDSPATDWRDGQMLVEM